MYSLLRIVVVGSCVVAWAGTATAQVGSSKAAQAFKDANRLYQQQDYSRAAEKYEEAVQLDPSLPGVYSYLANSYDNLYRPSRKGESQNDEWLRRAVENYRKSADIDKDPRLKKLAREYLIAA
jgi:Tfp pilus assembly protein PilF